MKHLEFLKKLSDKEIVKLVNEYFDLHKKSGILPEKSLLRKLTEIVCEDYQSPFNLTLGENALTEEVLKRYKRLYGDIYD